MRLLQLYEADERGVVPAAGGRICALPDADSALVRREVNGEYSMTVNLPAGAGHLNDVLDGQAIKATVNEQGKEQFFIVQGRRRTLTGGMEIYAEHQSYYYNGVVVTPFTGGPALYEHFLNRIRLNSLPDLSGLATFTYARAQNPQKVQLGPSTPQMLRSMLLDWLISNFGGEIDFDGFDVTWRDRLGADRGVEFRYAANLLDMEAEDVADGWASGILPYWGELGSTDKPYTTMPSPIYRYAGSYPREVITPVDFTDAFDTQPTAAQLAQAAADYEALHAGPIPLSIRASRTRMSGDKPIDLGDTVRVVNGRWSVDARIRVMALTFDALRGRVQDVDLGIINPGFPGSVASLVTK